MDWSSCRDTERRPDVLSNTWVVRGTRVPADAIVSNARDGYTPDEIVSDMFPSVSLERARAILTFAYLHYQQNMVGRRLALPIPPTNKGSAIRANADPIQQALDEIGAATYRALVFKGARMG